MIRHKNLSGSVNYNAGKVKPKSKKRSAPCEFCGSADPKKHNWTMHYLPPRPMFRGVPFQHKKPIRTLYPKRHAPSAKRLIAAARKWERQWSGVPVHSADQALYRAIDRYNTASRKLAGRGK